MEKHFVTGRSESVCKEFIKIKSKKKKGETMWKWLFFLSVFLFGIFSEIASALKLDYMDVRCVKHVLITKTLENPC